MLAKVVERQNLDVDTARDGVEAIERIDRNGYSVVVLDLMMPRVDGFGVLRHMRERRPELLIGVGGCVASQEGEGISRRAPFVDLVFGPQTLHRLPEMVDDVRRHGRAVVDVSFPEIEKFDRLPEPARFRTAFAKAADERTIVVPRAVGKLVRRRSSARGWSASVPANSATSSSSR